MATRNPLVLVDGTLQELPTADILSNYGLAAKQDSIAKKAVFLWRPTTATAGLWIGTGGSGNGTYATTLPVATGSIYEGMKIARYSNIVTTANQTLGQRNTELLFHRGSVANKGGFYFEATWGFTTWTNGGRMFVGLSSTTNNVVSVEPSVNPVSIGFAIDAADNGLIYAMSRDLTTTTRTSTGITATSLNAYECSLKCAPNGTSVDWWIRDLETGTEASGTLSTNLPPNTTTMTAGVLASNAALTPVNSIQLGVQTIYIQTDY